MDDPTHNITTPNRHRSPKNLLALCLGVSFLDANGLHFVVDEGTSSGELESSWIISSCIKINNDQKNTLPCYSHEIALEMNCNKSHQIILEISIAKSK
jgi:hypothetical protein